MTPHKLRKLKPSPLLACLLLLCCGSETEPVVDSGAPDRGAPDAGAGKAITSATVTGSPTKLYYFGDLWTNTWADDDKLYLSFGDGTGINGCVPTFDAKTPGAWGYWKPDKLVSPNCFNVKDSCPKCGVRVEFCRTFDCTKCYPLCPYTDAGLMVLSGTVPALDACTGESCIVQRNLPTPKLPPMTLDGKPTGKDDKPSSLLYLDGKLYMAGHSPAGAPKAGYLAWSGDKGKNWTVVSGSKWTGASHFRVLMLINMGKAYAHNTDGYVYGMGVDAELSPAKPMGVYLAPRKDIATYEKWEYYTGTTPPWSGKQDQAKALAGLQTQGQGSAVYHKGTGRYLFLSGVADALGEKSALFEAPQPWGPWTKVATLPKLAISSFLAKGAGARHVYYARAGGTTTYNLNIVKLTLKTQ